MLTGMQIAEFVSLSSTALPTARMFVERGKAWMRTAIVVAARFFWVLSFCNKRIKTPISPGSLLTGGRLAKCLHVRFSAFIVSFLIPTIRVKKTHLFVFILNAARNGVDLSVPCDGRY
jgi:hypothetical protein